MKTVLVAAMSVGALLAATGDADAYTKYRAYGYAYSPYYSSNAELKARKARNEWAYNHGQYWEHDSNALRVGSRAWIEQKDREGGFGRH
jgi:hypothetical protein